MEILDNGVAIYQGGKDLGGLGFEANIVNLMLLNQRSAK